MRFFIVKGLRAILLLTSLVILIYTLAHFSPIDPTIAYFGADININPDQLAKFKELWGLDQPVYIQFTRWINAILHGDFGTSMTYRKPVMDVILPAFTNSLVLMLTAWTFSGIIGFIIGSLSAFYRGKLIDKVIRWCCITLVSTPANVMALILIIVFGLWLNLFPVGLSSPIGKYIDISFFDRLEHFILPCCTLTLLGIANVAMHTREEMLQTLDSEFVLYAYARGETNWQVFKNHGIKNSCLPVIMIQFSYFGELFGGSALAEVVFAYLGLGSIMVEAGIKGDLPLLLATVLISALFVFTGNIIADILAQKYDHRLREVI